MSNFSAYVKRIAHSSIFKAIIMAAILLNTVTFAIASSIEPSESNMVFVNILDGIDSCFLALYCMEFFIKLHSFGRGYWFNGFNCFDFGVLLCSLLQLVLSQTGAKNLGVIKVMRSLRALRPLRSVSLIGGLQVVVTALIATFTGSFIHIILLLCLIMFVYGIMAFYVYGYNPASDSSRDYWGTFGNSYLSLFVLVTAEGWFDVMDSLKKTSQDFGLYFFIISFLFIGHFIFGNLFVAVVIEQIDRATAGYHKRKEIKKETVVLNKMKRARKMQESEIKNIVNQMKSGDFRGFPSVVLNMYRHIRKDEFAVKAEVKCVPLWVESFNLEYQRLARDLSDIRSYNLEIVDCMGKLLNEMDQSVQQALIVQSLEEQAVFRRKTRNTSFQFLRRISQRLSFFGNRQHAGRNLLGETVTDSNQHLANETIIEESVPSEIEIEQSCLSCFGYMSDCRCKNPEQESRELGDELAGRADRLYSATTENWMKNSPYSNSTKFPARDR